MKTSEYHITQMKPFNYDEMEVDRVEDARKEQQEFEVEAILEHRNPNNSKFRRDYEFLIQWKRYGPEANSWVEWDLIKQNELMTDYLYTHKLRKWMTPEERQAMEVHQYPQIAQRRRVRQRLN
jgi:hypothetical protein